MNVNQIINMIIRQVMRRMINGGINKGMDMASNRGTKKRKPNAVLPEDHSNAPNHKG